MGKSAYNVPLYVSRAASGRHIYHPQCLKSSERWQKCFSPIKCSGTPVASKGEDSGKRRLISSLEGDSLMEIG